MKTITVIFLLLCGSGFANDSAMRDLERTGYRVLELVHSRNEAAMAKLIGSEISDYYRCYIFDLSCTGNEGVKGTVWGLATRKTRIKVKVVVSGSEGLIYWFDPKQIAASDLRPNSERFCALWGKSVFTWRFKHDGKRWIPAALPFDGETDYLCSEGY